MPANEKLVWKQIMASVPHGLIKPAAYSLLEMLCHHVALARTLRKQLKRCKPGSSQSAVIAKMIRGETSAMILVARQLRLSPRSQTNPRNIAREMDRQLTEASVEKPWEA
jgi:hypothetical protein